MGKHVIITGASSGIGECLAYEFGKRGYDIGLLARREDELSRVAQALRSSGAAAAYRTADVTDLEGLTSAIRELEAEQGSCEMLVANAGVIGRYSARKHDASLASWMMRVNYDGAVNAVDAVLPGMLERGSGRLAVVASVAGYRGLPKMQAYSASKAAISNYWEGLRVELAPKGIACTTICPGFIRTAMTEDNTNPMPFLRDADDVVPGMVDAVERGARTHATPLPMAVMMALSRALPTWLYDPVLRLSGI